MSANGRTHQSGTGVQRKWRSVASIAKQKELHSIANLHDKQRWISTVSHPNLHEVSFSFESKDPNRAGGLFPCEALRADRKHTPVISKLASPCECSVLQ